MVDTAEKMNKQHLATRRIGSSPLLSARAMDILKAEKRRKALYVRAREWPQRLAQPLWAQRI